MFPPGLRERRPLLYTLAGAAGAAAGFYATAVEPFRPRTEQVEVKLRGGGGPVLRIVHLSDLHVRNRRDHSLLACALPMVRDLEPDLIVVTGDLIENTRSNAADCIAWLEQFHAPLGVFACPGTHEHLPEGDPPPEFYAGAVRILSDEAEPLTLGGATFWLAGFDDGTYTPANFAQTLRDVPDGATTILLSHSPDHIYDAAARGVDLVLSGHTHGGQVCLPLVGPLMTNTRYGRRFAAGLFQVNGTQMYVNRGLGTVIMRLRFGCPPEVTLLQVELPGP
jgi:predicted MPP superfamily phosphohydrolase